MGTQMLPLKFGAIAAIAGALVLTTGTMLHPMDADPGDALAAFTEYAADTHWVASHLTQFLGIALMLVGLVAIRDVVRGDPAEWIARLGMILAVAATSIAAALQAVDGIALKVMVNTWASAPPDQKPGAFMAAFAVRQIETGLASFMAMLFGTTVILYGTAFARSKSFPSWLGFLGVAGGLGTLVGGVLMAGTGFTATEMNVAMPSSLAVVVWMILAGVVLWRRAPRSLR
jgi:hypothetical protein